MKVVILAGGIGSRLGGLGRDRPKPLVEVGNKPILWHVLKHFGSHGFHEFVIALGHRGDAVKSWLHEQVHLQGSITFDLSSGSVERHKAARDGWVVHAVETGTDTETGSRIGRLAEWVGDRTFLLSWCDGLSDIDLGALVAFHHGHGRLATMTVVRPTSPYGRAELEGDVVARYREKPLLDEWVSGGYFVLEPDIFQYIDTEDASWERDCLPRLARDGQLMAYQHAGYWQCMDTPAQQADLENAWAAGRAPWADLADRR